MEKRFFLFLAISLLIMTSYMWVYTILFPPPPLPDKPAQGEAVAEETVKDKPNGEENDAGEATSAKIGPGGSSEDPENGDNSESPASAHKVAPRELISVGSLSPDSPFRYLALFDSRGGTIRRIELNERKKSGEFKYRSLENKGGYLGHLELTDEPGGGCRVNVVGKGTPAAMAKSAGGPNSKPGLKVGDVLMRVNEATTDSVAEFNVAMNDLRDGNIGAPSKDEVTLEVHRNGKTLNFTTQLIEQPLAILSPDHDRQQGVSKDTLVVQGVREARPGVDPQLSFPLVLGYWSDDKWKPFSPAIADAMLHDNWQTKVIGNPSSPGVEFRFLIDEAMMQGAGRSGSLEVVKRYTLTPTSKDEKNNPLAKSYHLTFEVEIHNRGEKPQQVAYRMDGPSGLPIEGWWYANKIGQSMGAAGARDVTWRSKGTEYKLWGCPAIVKNTLKEKTSKNIFFPPNETEVANRTLLYIGGDTRYFAVLPKPADGEQSDNYAYLHGEAIVAQPLDAKVDRGAKAKRVNTTFRLVSDNPPIAPGKSLKQKFTVFAGPKHPELLELYGVRDVAYYGWFGTVSRPLIWLLHAFEAIPGVNYGLAIIMLTILVRVCMVPISRKAAKNAQMMQYLQPEMKKIAEKYKNDMEKRGKAQQDLFRQHNYNPFGGCLLMFLQLPIFLGLYRALAVDISLRDQPLISGMDSWCSNLAGPDEFLNWSSWMPAFLASETGWLGPYLNVLPLITVVLFIIQQKMFTPPPTDEQQAMTQKMMSFMTIIIGFMFFKVPSGLCVYFITSSMWGIAERKLLPKPKLPAHLKPPGEEKGVKSKPKPPPSKPSSNGADRRKKEKQRKKKARGRR